MQDRTQEARACRILDIIDGFTEEALGIRPGRKLNSTDLLDAPTDLVIPRGPPAFIRSGNGPECVAQAVRDWIVAVGSKTACIEPGSPRENGDIDRSNARFRDELPDGEIFHPIREAEIRIEHWRCHYTTVRPHNAPGSRPSEPDSIVPMDQTPVMHQQ